ncbi:class I SAM-dependent methyltransferase [Confluentibacter flavum]|uniref:SAM-dependent methyltransferase n=1 Tax=Confluentibacter flavum TaxID=1909700 RepID=A0A2N3HNV6_9FLAO|nr:methyltransferase domain-containing protein [Confluentibacter flavum]PKQ46528.1 SAM-dependent methyltransferase [Confluentibacter flavum]
MSKDTSNWFSSWFNTPYYHILYRDRNDTEAHAFMDTLTNYLNIPEQGTILDLACGRGRHAMYLNTIGYDVTGVDLSENNIKHAKKHENHRLRFDVHDMCKPYKRQFDAVFNLYTSFGYFDFDVDNLNTIKAIKANLNETGFGVIDFMNSALVIENLVPEEIKTVGEIDFNLKRFVENGYIIKDITFEADGEAHHYQERVKAFSLKDFEALFEQADTYLLDVFGDYKLNKFRPQTSERLVMIFK